MTLDGLDGPGLTGKVAIVTGAGKGLGRAYARRLAGLGARVLVNNRLPRGQDEVNSADRVVAEIESAGGVAFADYTSVEADNAGEQIVARAVDQFGQLDIIIANAGVERPSSFAKQSQAEFESNFLINFFGVSRLLRAAWPSLRQADDAAVLVSTSTAGLYGNHGQTAYSASKAALQGLVRSLAIEGVGHHIRVNALAPYAYTQMTDSFFPAEQAQRFSPEAVASLAAWLLSPGCSYSGETFISGAGYARRVQHRETASVKLGDTIGSLEVAIEDLMTRPCDIAPDSANAEFDDFIRQLEMD